MRATMPDDVIFARCEPCEDNMPHLIGPRETICLVCCSENKPLNMITIASTECPRCHAPAGEWCQTSGTYREDNKHNFHPALAHVERERLVTEHNRAIRARRFEV